MARNDERRPDADSLLELSKEEERGGRGRLTIYFGAAPGVGKTYAMLADARRKKEEGVDVVVGYYEAHARPETEALIAGQEILPRREIDYRGLALQEMDLDAILARHPALVLVDELAHTNAPGARHAKRYQDVEEILNAGIDVYATLNVQHLESTNDVVHQITGIRVAEKVPDTLFQSAAEVKVIDLPFEDLLQRLNEGKVYVKGMASEAIRRFFQPGNLMALRQMALRLSASRVDERMRRHMRAHAIAGPWAVSERILVSVYASPYAERLVRQAFRLASEMAAPWTALYVEGPGHARLTEKERRWLEGAFDIARSLGAQIAWVKGDDVAGEIARFAAMNNVTKIVMGRPRKLVLFPSIVRRIMARLPNVDIFLFAGEEAKPLPRTKRRLPRLRLADYALSLLGVGVASAVGQLFKAELGEVNLLFLMLIPIIWSALTRGRGPSILAAVVSMAAFDYLFVAPHYTFTVGDLSYMISFVVYLAVAVVIGNLASRLRSRMLLLRQSESNSAALREVSTHLVTAQTVEQVLAIILQHARQALPGEMAIFLPTGAELSASAATAEFSITPKELGVATWVLVNGKPAGQGTETLPQAWAHYSPMRTAQRIIGVIGIHFDDPSRTLTPDSEAVFEAIAGLGAMAIERIQSEGQLSGLGDL
jgi:two-component system, OmpR family, sensor histidine kinase KdpD